MPEAVRSARRSGSRVPPWTLAVAAMLSMQLASAWSVGLVQAVGPAGTAWLRLSLGAVILLAMARPPLRSIRRQDIPTLVGLGLSTGLMSVAFLAAIDRIPLGTAVAIEFLGPLTVAALRGRSVAMLAWPGLALIGVVLLTEPWLGEIDAVGVALAAIAGLGWGSYILLTQRIGDRFTGIGTLSLTVPIAAVMVAPLGVPQAAVQLDVSILLIGAGLAILAPVLPLVLEMVALRRMAPTAFGTLMALEPGMGVLLGLFVLHQAPSIIQVAGIALVVLAGAAAQRGGERPATAPSDASGAPARTTATLAQEG